MIVGEVPIGFEIEGVIIPLASDQERELVAKRVPDSELVEDVRIVNRDIGNNQISGHEQVKHVLADVSGFNHGLRGIGHDM